MGPIVASQLATGLGVLAGAVLVKSVLEKPMAGPWPRCPSCNGTGRVRCMCSRWSDGDVGCRTCSGSGLRGCSSCGGTGTGRPIPVQLSISSSPSSFLRHQSPMAPPMKAPMAPLMKAPMIVQALAPLVKMPPASSPAKMAPTPSMVSMSPTESPKAVSNRVGAAALLVVASAAFLL